MEINELLVRQITDAVIRELHQDRSAAPGGEDRIEKVDYSGYPRAEQGTDPKEVVIGVGAAFQTVIKNTITGIPLDDVIRNIIVGIEEEGMTARVVKNLKTSDVGFIGLEAAKLSGSGIGIGLQSKGTTVIHHKDDTGDIFQRGKECGKICEGREGTAHCLYQRSDGPGEISGESGADAHPGDRPAVPGIKYD